MPRILRCGLILAVLAVVPVLAQDQATEKDAKDADPKLTWAAELVGKITRINPKNRTFTVGIDPRASLTPAPVAKTPDKTTNPKVKGPTVLSPAQKLEIVRLQREIQSLQVATFKAKTVQDRTKIQQAIKDAQARIQAVAKGEVALDPPAAKPDPNVQLQERDFAFADNLVVRALEPPAAFDDKGNFKTYTAEELDKLRGPDKRLPGYPSETRALRTGLNVRLYLARSGSAATPKDADKEKTKGKGKGPDPSTLSQVIMIYIMDKME